MTEDNLMLIENNLMLKNISEILKRYNYEIEFYELKMLYKYFIEYINENEIIVQAKIKTNSGFDINLDKDYQDGCMKKIEEICKKNNYLLDYVLIDTFGLLNGDEFCANLKITKIENQ